MSEVANNWIMIDNSRKRFWAHADELGLTDEQAREALGLGPDADGEYASTKTYAGSLEEALKALRSYAADQRTETNAVALLEAGHPPCILFSQAISKSGWEVNFTVKGKTVDDALIEFGRMTKRLEAAGARPVHSSRFSEQVRTQSKPAAPQTPPARGTSEPQQRPQSTDWPGYSGVKTGAVEQIQVNPDGGVELAVDNAQYPLKHSAKAPTPISDLFEPDCFTQAFAPMHLHQPGFYQPEGLVVTYGKSDRGYWDILQVRRE